MDAVSTLPFTGRKTSRFHATTFRGRPMLERPTLDHTSGLLQQQQQQFADEDNVLADASDRSELYGEGDLEQNSDGVCSDGSTDDNDGCPPRDQQEHRPVIGGSILIRNGCRLDDSSSGSRLVDMVEGGDDPNDSFIVEQNANLFDGNYFQTRENPLYSSDQDLSEDRRNTDGEPVKKEDSNSDNSNDFKMSSKSKDWLDTVQVDDVDQSNGGTGSSKYDVASLLADAPLDSIRQKISVDRDEQVVEGPLPVNEEALLNTDVVSEKVDLDLLAGQVQVTVCVRCERTVPLYSMDSVYKKSSVIVTRRVQIDMDCTEMRRQLYAALQRRQYNNSNSDSSRLRLSAKETFQLYKGFMGLVEANENARTNSFKPQPGSILSDDIDIFKRPPSRNAVNGISTSSNRYADQISRDNHENSDSLPLSAGRVPLSRETVVKATPSELFENRFSSTEERTPYSSRMTSRPDYGTSSINSDTEMSSTAMTSPYSMTSSISSSVRPRHDDILNRSTYGDQNISSSYSNRFSSTSRDQRESRSDNPRARMSAYEKYRSRSPYGAEDRMTSRTAMADLNANTDATTRPASRYERIMASRSRSPFRSDNGTTTTPYFTRTISLDSENNTANYGTDENITRDTSRFDSLLSKPPSEDRPYTSAIIGSTPRRASIDLSCDGDGYPRSTLPSRFSGLQLTATHDSGSTPSYESRFSSSRASGDKNGATADYLSSRFSHLRSTSSPFSTTEEINPYYTSRHSRSSSLSRDNSLTDLNNSLNKYTMNDDYSGRNGTRNEIREINDDYSSRNGIRDERRETDILSNTTDSTFTSPTTNFASSYLTRKRSEGLLETGDIIGSVNHRQEAATDSEVTSSRTEDDTWKPVADAIGAAITSLNHVATKLEVQNQSSELSSPRTPRIEPSITAIPEKAASRPEVGRIAQDSQSSIQIVQPINAEISSPAPSETHVRRLSTTSNPSAAASAGPGALAPSMRPTAASLARRNSTTQSGSTTTTTSRAVPSYASSTSSSASKTSSASGTTPKSSMPRTNSSPALRDANGQVKLNQRTPTTTTGPSTQSKPPPRAPHGRSDATASASGTPTERRGSASSSSKEIAPFSSSTSQRTAAPSVGTAAVSEFRRSRNSSGSFSENIRTSGSTSENVTQPQRPVSATRTTPTTASSGRRTPTGIAVQSASSSASSRVTGRTTSTTTGAMATSGGPPTTPSSRPPIATTPASTRPVNAVRPYRSRNSSTSLNN